LIKCNRCGLVRAHAETRISNAMTIESAIQQLEKIDLSRMEII